MPTGLAWVDFRNNLFLWIVPDGSARAYAHPIASGVCKSPRAHWETQAQNGACVCLFSTHMATLAGGLGHSKNSVHT